MYAEQLTAHYREIGRRLRPVPPPIMIIVRPRRKSTYAFVPSDERHILPPLHPIMSDAQKIIAAVIALSGISRPTLLGFGRSNDIIPYRHIMQMIMREETGLSYPSIGRYFPDGRDHTSTKNAYHRGRELVDNQPHWRQFHQSVLRMISAPPSYTLGDSQ